MSDVDKVVLIITGGALLIGLISMAIGKVAEVHDRVKDYASSRRPLMSTPHPSKPQTSMQTTDRRADRLSVSAAIEKPPRLQLDRTRGALIEELLTLGWTMTDFRREQIFRGDNNKISAEVEDARQRLGISAPPTPIAPVSGRPYDPKLFHSDDPSLQYQDLA